jgi:uncharacterized protein (UPF0332 family)
LASKNVDNIEEYKQKALEEIRQVERLLRSDALALCASRSYYAAFYAIKALLESIGVKTGSHKQTHVEFRKYFIKTQKLDKKYSKILTELFEVRSSADYDVHWATNKILAGKIVKQAKELVAAVLGTV